MSIKKRRRKRKEIKGIQLDEKIVDIMTGKTTIQKYLDPESPIVKTHINVVEIPNTLIDLGAAINIMSKQTMNQLELSNLQYTPTLLQLEDRSVIKPNGVLEDIYVSLDSWEYTLDFMILTPKDNLGGHPLILGRPWLATTDAFISYRSGDMFISNGSATNKFTLYPLEKSTVEVENEEWIDDDFNIRPIFSTSQLDEEDQILNLMENNESSSYCESSQSFQEQCNIEYLSSRQLSLESMEKIGNSTIGIFLGKTLNMKNNLE